MGALGMPGSVIGRQAVIYELSQVLKGEVVPDGQHWAGQSPP
jgi:hypothetical protein